MGTKTAVSTVHSRSSRTISTKSTSAKGPVRKRRCTTKTRSGCLTCKKRRVRCDEHKPACWNCLKSKDRVCFGYQQTEAQLASHSVNAGQASPPDSVTASSSSTVSASPSSNTSASNTPIGPHAPKSFSIDASFDSWSQNVSLDWAGRQATSYFPIEDQLPPAPQSRSMSLATPILNRPTLALRRHASSPGGNTVTVDKSTTHSQPFQAAAWDYTLAQTTIPATTRPQVKPDQDLFSRNNPDILQRRHSQPILDTDFLTLSSYRPAPSPFTINPAISPLIVEPSTARTFAFYLHHSGSAMGARSSPSFFLSTIPQIASHCAHVRYALLAVALVDGSVNDHATNNGKYGPGIECIDHEARKASFEMYGRAVRALVDAKHDSSSLASTNLSHPTNLTRRELDDALAAILITCLLLFSFEYWLWNHRNAARHLEGALGLMQSYEQSMEGKQRGGGLLEEKVLPMMKQAVRYHEMSLHKGMPASKFGEGATWDPNLGVQ